MNSSTVIQKFYRGFSVRKHNLPFVLHKFKNSLISKNIYLSNINADGRINSSIHEDIIIHHLYSQFPDLIKIPKSRMWYDILAYDYSFGWIPINIKSTSMKTSDNTGNLAMLVYSYTNYNMNMFSSYNNGYMSKILINSINNKNLNFSRRDYFFLVVNKDEPSDIIINSIRGLSKLTPNINNLPFQVKWNDNKTFIYKPLIDNINMFIQCIKYPKTNWKENFVSSIRNMNTFN